LAPATASAALDLGQGILEQPVHLVEDLGPVTDIALIDAAQQSDGLLDLTR
jgi:hypothetical protein